MTIAGLIPAIFAVASAVAYLFVTRADLKQLAGWTYLASMIALMIALSGHVARLVVP